MSEKVDFITVKIMQILLNTQKKFLYIVQIFYNKVCEYLLIFYEKSLLNITPVNILYTNVEIKTCLDFLSKQTNITGLHPL